MIKNILLAAVAISAAVPVTAQAEPGQTIVIDASGLQTPLGARRFKAALNGALEQVCGAYGSTEHDQWRAIDDCRDTAMRSVNQQLAVGAGRKDVRLAVR